MGIICLLVLLILSLTLGIVIIANILKPGQNVFCDDKNLGFDFVKEANDFDLKMCFCRLQSQSAIFSSEQAFQFCQFSQSDQSLMIYITLISSFIIVLINIFIRVIFKKFSKFIRCKSFTQEATTLTVLFFISTFVNTAIPAFLNNPLFSTESEQAEYSTNFSRDVRARVGTNIILTLAMGIISPHVFELVWGILQNKIRTMRAKTQLLQSDMNKLVIGSEFNIAGAYSNMLTTIFVCLFFSAGQPILLLFGGLSLVLQFVCQKTALLRLHRAPPSIDGSLSETVLSLLPWGLVLHLMIGLYEYQQPLIFPRSVQVLKSAVECPLGMNKSSLFFNDKIDLSDSRTFVPMLYFFTLLIALAFAAAHNAILRLFLKIHIFITKSSRFEDKHQMSEPDFLFENAKKIMELSMLCSYDILKNDTYAPLIEAMNQNNNFLSSINKPQQTRIIPSSSLPKFDIQSDQPNKIEV